MVPSAHFVLRRAGDILMLAQPLTILHSAPLVSPTTQKAPGTRTFDTMHGAFGSTATSSFLGSVDVLAGSFIPVVLGSLISHALSRKNVMFSLPNPDKPAF